MAKIAGEHIHIRIYSHHVPSISQSHELVSWYGSTASGAVSLLFVVPD